MKPFDMTVNTIGVIFDVDGVLIDSAAPHLQSWQRLAEENGRTVTSEQFSSTFGRTNRDIIPILFGDIPTERLRALSERKEVIYRALIRDRVPVVSGARELVRQLHLGGVRLAIGSSGPRENIELVIDALDAREMFQAIVCAEDVTRGKPDPQVFEIAIRRIGVAPGRCIVVEDAPAGVAAARAAGAKAVAVLMHHAAAAFEGANLVVDRLDHLSAYELFTLVRD